MSMVSVKRPHVYPVGTRGVTQQGCAYEVVEVLKGKKRKVFFTDTGNYKVIHKTQIKKGNFTNPVISKNKLGFSLGSDYNYKLHGNPVIMQCFVGMHSRAKCGVTKAKQKTYSTTTVDPIWDEYMSFYHWYRKQQVCGETKYQLDKDIKIQGNTVYGPSTCLLVPSEVNKFFTLRGNARGKFKLGVFKTRRVKGFCAAVSENGVPKSLGSYDTEEQAHQAYLLRKKELQIELANKFKDVITNEAYKAILRFKIEEEV